MPVLKQPRRERFAQQLAKGITQAEAYEIAGYKKDERNASKLALKPEVASRVREITGYGAHRAVVTVESLCDELEEARQLAIKLDQPSPMVMASMGKARITRLLDEVVRHVGANGGSIKHSIEVRFVPTAQTIEHDEGEGDGGT